MDDTYRIKATHGANTFEAEGPTEIVRADFQAWRDMVANSPTPMPQNPQIDGAQRGFDPPVAIPKQDTPNIDAALNKIMRVENRIVSLTARPTAVDEAVLLLLYGQKVLRENDSVTGAEIMDGISATGGFGLFRVDRLLEGMAREGDVIVIGERRSKRYRLTNTGITRARQAAVDLIAIVA
ncbi:MAG TPA: hypothetical protein VHQ22_04820 [Terriglobales bacterium]|jgi:hypothetical protein|nr:hypothetical protein [Terriglobales bacterium]